MSSLSIFLVSSSMVCLGYYVGADEHAAIQACLDDAGSSDEPQRLTAEEWGSYAALRAEAHKHGDDAMVATVDRAEQGDIEALELVAETLNNALHMLD